MVDLLKSLRDQARHLGQTRWVQYPFLALASAWVAGFSASIVLGADYRIEALAWNYQEPERGGVEAWFRRGELFSTSFLVLMGVMAIQTIFQPRANRPGRTAWIAVPASGVLAIAAAFLFAPNHWTDQSLEGMLEGMLETVWFWGTAIVVFSIWTFLYFTVFTSADSRRRAQRLDQSRKD